MEFIRISDSKLKIMLDGQDMDYYDIDTEALSGEGEDGRRVMRRLLEDARRRSGFDVTGERILVEMYPSKVGGCELYVTRLHDDEPTVGEARPSRQEPKKERELPTASEGENYALLYMFDSMEALLAVCRQLSATGFRGRSAAYAETNGSFFLALSERKKEARGLYIEKKNICPVAEEYGRRRERRSLVGVKETAICLADGDAVSRLAPYYVGHVSDRFDGIDDIV